MITIKSFFKDEGGYYCQFDGDKFYYEEWFDYVKRSWGRGIEE